MPDDPQPAALVDDAVQHSYARLGRWLGGIGGGIAAGALLVSAGALEFFSMGLATPVAIGMAALAVGGLGAAISKGSDLGADLGRHFGHDEGTVASGLPTILVGPHRKALAHVNSNANCNNHKHLSVGPCSDVINPAQEQIAEGSETVLVGLDTMPAARVGSQGTCRFKVGHGCPTLIIGGPTIRLLDFDGEDDPDKKYFDFVGTVTGYIGIAGVALVLWSATLTVGGVAIMAGGGVGAWLVGQGIGKGLEYLPEGEVRDAAGLVLALLPLKGMGKMARGLSPTEGLGRAKGESEEGFTSRVKAAKNARLEAEWRARVQASKLPAGRVPLGPFGRPIPAYARASGAARVLFDDGGGVFRPKRGNIMEARATGGKTGSAGVKLTIKKPSIFSRTDLTTAERAYLEKQWKTKKAALTRAAKRGDLKWSPGTDNVRLSQLQAEYRQAVAARFQRRFGRAPDIDRLDADHPVDMIVGGDADQNFKMLHRSINRSVGSSLKAAGKNQGLAPGTPIQSVDFDE